MNFQQQQTSTAAQTMPSTLIGVFRISHIASKFSASALCCYTWWGALSMPTPWHWTFSHLSRHYSKEPGLPSDSRTTAPSLCSQCTWRIKLLQGPHPEGAVHARQAGRTGKTQRRMKWGWPEQGVVLILQWADLSGVACPRPRHTRGHPSTVGKAATAFTSTHQGQMLQTFLAVIAPKLPFVPLVML